MEWTPDVSKMERVSGADGTGQGAPPCPSWTRRPILCSVTTAKKRPFHIYDTPSYCK
jgi:hypothetical protein